MKKGYRFNDQYCNEVCHNKLKNSLFTFTIPLMFHHNILFFFNLLYEKLYFFFYRRQIVIDKT